MKPKNLTIGLIALLALFLAAPPLLKTQGVVYDPLQGRLVLRQSGGGLGSATGAEIAAKFTGSGTYLKADGTQGAGDGLGSATAANIVAKFNSGTCSGYLKSDGSCSTPTSGGLVGPLETCTIDNAAECKFTTPSTYDIYQFKLVNVEPVVDGDNLRFQVYTDGGTTPISTNSYTTSPCTVNRAGAVSAGGSETAAASVDLSCWNIDNTVAEGGLTGTYDFSNAASTAHWKTMSGDSWFRDSAQFRLKIYITGRYEATTAVTNVRFFMAGGNLSTGTIYKFAYAK